MSKKLEILKKDYFIEHLTEEPKKWIFCRVNLLVSILMN